MDIRKPVVGLGVGLSLVLSAAAFAQDNSTTLPTPPIDTKSVTGQDDTGTTAAPIDPKAQAVTVDRDGDTKGVSGALKFGDLDVNGNGTISQSEMSGKAALKGKFKSMDTDKNGEVSDAEFSAFTSASPKGVDASAKGRDKSGKSRDEEESEVDKNDLGIGDDKD